MTQKELMGLIVAAARARDWRVAHFHTVQAVVGTRTRWMTPVAADGKGFPDLLLVRERVLVAEVKGGGHKPTPEQQEWMFAFRLAGCVAVRWTPRDWEDGLVVAELERRVPYAPVDVAA